MRKTVFLISIMLVGCFPSNDDTATMDSYIKHKEIYYSYYTQDMWDAKLEFVLKTSYKPRRSIKSVNAKINVDKDSIIYSNGTSYKEFTEKKLKIESDKVELCDRLGCKILSE